MSDRTDRPGEAVRLEQLWQGQFGDDYVERNAAAGADRGPFWQEVLTAFPARSVLEVGCNVGANLRHLSPPVPPTALWGVDINERALAQLHREQPELNAGWATARDLPFRDRRFDLVFTVAVLIHQPDDTLAVVLNEMARCARRWVLAIEYDAPERTDVNYRGQPGAFLKRDYERLIGDVVPGLTLARSAAVTKADGFDDGMGCWVFAVD